MVENTEVLVKESMPAVSVEGIKGLIITVRGMQVLLDSDVAKLYGYETKAINLAAKRNADRFPHDFRFQLTEEELVGILRFQIETSKSNDNCPSENRGGRRSLPFVYSEHGILSLAGVLRNKTAAQVSISITRAFVEMRRFIDVNQNVFAKIIGIDNKLLEHDHRFQEVFKLLQQPEALKQSIFYKGQFYDAFKLVIDLIVKATTSITIIDNYADSFVLEMLSHKRTQVEAIIITANPNKLSEQHLNKFAAQYGDVTIVGNSDFHDRFIILDDSEVYVFGGSLKDLGKKCFGVFRSEDPEELLIRVNSIVQSKQDHMQHPL